MRLERRGRPRRVLDLAPLVDVVFLLLLFFLLASDFQRDRALPLEVAAAASAPPADAVTDVELRTDGGVWLDGERADLDAVDRAFAANRDRPIAVRPDPDVSLARIHRVLQLAVDRGAGSASLVRSF